MPQNAPVYPSLQSQVYESAKALQLPWKHTALAQGLLGSSLSNASLITEEKALNLFLTLITDKISLYLQMSLDFFTNIFDAVFPQKQQVKSNNVLTQASESIIVQTVSFLTGTAETSWGVVADCANSRHYPPNIHLRLQRETRKKFKSVVN